MSTHPGSLDVGIAFDLRSDFAASGDDPDDLLEEYDSEETIAAIAAAIERGGHSARALGGGRRLLQALMDDPPQLVFNICEGSGGRSREAHAPAVCELLGIPYTHSDPLTLAVCLDKDVSKRLVASAGIATPRYRICNGQLGDLDGLVPPLIAKPLAEGSSKGIRGDCLFDSRESLVAVVEQLATDYDQPVLVEEFCPGPEITVGVVGTGDGARVLGSMEVDLVGGDPGRFVYSLEVKREFVDRVRYHVPPRTHQLEAERVALAAHRALGCRDVSRVDLRVGADGHVAFLELNPLPGLAPGQGDLVILAERLGIGHDEVVLGIIEEARPRWRI